MIRVSAINKCCNICRRYSEYKVNLYFVLSGFETALTTDSSLARAITTNDSSSSGSGEEESPSSSTSSSKEKELPNDIAMPGSSTSASKSSEDVKKEVKKATFKRTL